MIKKFTFIISIIFFINFLPRSINNEDTEKIKEPPRFEYSNKEEFIASLKNCISYLNTYTPKSKQINTELIIAQAVVESNYGTSRFAIEANNLFGIRTFKKEEMQLKPLKKPNANFGIKVFKSKCESVRYYITMINNHSAYSSFRVLRDSGVKESLILITKLYNFSENKMYYNLLKEVIINLRKDNNDSKNIKA